MPTVEISKETMKKLRAFTRVVNCTIERELESESKYAELVLDIGMERMLQDIIPPGTSAIEEFWAKGNSHAKVLRDSVVLMFRENPEFVSKFVVDTLKRGEMVRKEEAKKAKADWRSYIG